MVNIWIEQEKEATEADTITNFKRHLGRYLNRRGIEVDGPKAGKLD